MFPSGAFLYSLSLVPTLGKKTLSKNEEINARLYCMDDITENAEMGMSIGT